MNAKKWRALGFFTLFRAGVCYLVRKSDGVCRSAPVARGEWLRLDAFEDFEPAELTGEMSHSLQFCYCDSGCGTCDFCVGVRKAPELPNKWAKPLPWTI